MTEKLGRLLSLSVVLLLAVAVPPVSAQEEPLRFKDTTCTPAAYLHCPDSECSSTMVITRATWSR